jgi:nitrate/TMAO reductase-like tetraheme cytochrome c subunit
MSKKNKFSPALLTGIFLAMSLTVSQVYAHDDDEDEHHQKHERQAHNQDQSDRHASVASSSKLKAECGSCHVVYPPKMLPAASWREIMAHLDKHFGTDASVSAEAQRELSELLQKNASNRDEKVSGKPVLRISETRWFQDEHEEVSQRTWRNPKVKSASNCGACHTRADEGRFGEHEVRIPR